MCYYPLFVFFDFVGYNGLIKEVKRLVLRPLKTVVRESCVDFIILLPDYPIDSPFIFTSTPPLFLPRSRYFSLLYCSLLYFLYFTIITRFFLVLYNINRCIGKRRVTIILVWIIFLSLYIISRYIEK